ncbi:unnamed protein product [Alopecurus aequalis]
MNYLKNSRSSLSRLLRYNPARQPPPPPRPRGGAGVPTPRHYHASPRLPGVIRSSSRGLLRHEPAAVCRPQPAQAPPPRYYFTSSRRPQVVHFTRRRSGWQWYHDRRKVTAVVLLAGGAAVVVYFGNLETVPYTNRVHLVLITPQLERQLGESQFASLKKELAPKILPPLHPDSIRVRLIASEIVRALHRGLADSRRDDFSDASYGDISSDLAIKNRDMEPEDVMHHLSPDKDASTATAAQRNDELLDDRWVAESRKRGKARGAHPQTKHLNELNWEVIVVRDKMVNAMCLPGGKIVVFTGLLDHFKTDVEIATVISHEIGHAIARHVPEMLTRGMGLTILQLIVLQFIYMPDLINTMSNLLLRLPFSRRMEIEADHIGLMLQASAGFDPRFAPKVYEKLGKIAGNPTALKNYLSTHPSSQKRAELLSRAQVMEEAMKLYKEARAGHGTEGFL